MPKTKTKNRTKEELKALIEMADYLSAQERKEWIELVKTMTQKQINEAYEHFDLSLRRQEAFKIKLIVDAGLHNKLTKNITKISNEFINEVKKRKKQK